MTTWLFCYGSNDPDQLASRIFRKDFEVAPAYVNGYERVFRGFSRRWQGGTASLQQKPGARTFGYVASVTARDLAMLDQYEGVHHGIYRRDVIEVETPSAKRDAQVYVHTSVEFAEPSKEYLRAVAKTIGGFWLGKGGKVLPSDIPVR